ncbi:MAG: hypothetical protein ABIF19_00640 [Planctomycetota bacterium]
MQSASSTTLKFWWKVSSAEYSGYLKFYIDGNFQHLITGNVDWTEKTYNLSAGTHTLKWLYINDMDEEGENCGWVDFIQWTGATEAPDPANWDEIKYKHDVAGRRVEKTVDGYTTRYVHACGERSRIQRRPQNSRSLDYARDACARTAPPACSANTTAIHRTAQAATTCFASTSTALL